MNTHTYTPHIHVQSTVTFIEIVVPLIIEALGLYVAGNVASDSASEHECDADPERA